MLNRACSLNFTKGSELMAESKTKAQTANVEADTANVQAETVNVEQKEAAASSSLTLQSVDVSVTTGSNGYFNYDFDSNIDQVLATVNGGLMATASIEVTGDKTVRVRVFKGLVPLANKRVTVTLLGITH